MFSVISILDIFGFEDFPENGFEQLCINFANESLQHYFNKHIFKLEQAEYVKEKLEWTPIQYNDNQSILHMISKKPIGIFHLLDDESNFPKVIAIQSYQCFCGFFNINVYITYNLHYHTTIFNRLQTCHSLKNAITIML